MTWAISYTDDAEQDLQDIYDYISNVLIEPIINRHLMLKPEVRDDLMFG